MDAPTQPINLALGGNMLAPNDVSINEYCGPYGWGKRLGCTVANGISRYGARVLWAAFIITAIYMVVMFLGIIAEAEVIEANASVLGAAASYANAAYHQKCKNRGGCCKACPFISEADPRVAICKQEGIIDALHGQAKMAAAEDKDLLFSTMFKMPETTIALGTSISKDTFNKEWTMYVDTEAEAVRELGSILGKVQDLDKIYGNADSISVEVIDAKNKAISYGAAAVLRKNELIIASLTLNAQIMRKYIYEMDDVQQRKVIKYGEESIKAFNAADAIKRVYTAAVAAFVPGTPYSLAVSALSDSSTSSQDVLAAMATLLSLAQSSETSLRQTISTFSVVSNVYHKCQSVEPFSNDLPGKMDADKATSLIENNNFEEVIIRTALEADLVPNHRKFVKDRLSFDSGGGIPSIRDDDNDINPWVGLFGRPTYRKSNGTSADISTQPLQSIPSDRPTNLMRTSTLRLGTQRF